MECTHRRLVVSSNFMAFILFVSTSATIVEVATHRTNVVGLGGKKSMPVGFPTRFLT